MQELYVTIATIDVCFESIIDSDISTFAMFVEAASISFAPILTLK